MENLSVNHPDRRLPTLAYLIHHVEPWLVPVRVHTRIDVGEGYTRVDRTPFFRRETNKHRAYRFIQVLGLFPTLDGDYGGADYRLVLYHCDSWGGLTRSIGGRDELQRFGYPMVCVAILIRFVGVEER